ncbi:MAG: GNAT family N-acetyltransferase [Crocinitomicaceae bacterium]|jgi:ribosomal protein S18 acetylase RimI-like enzyme|nr:GNAT family N-acetyltransferase [Crocinitomicaceae bacterium]
MAIIRTQKLSADQSKRIDLLWNQEYPIQLKDRFPLLLQGTTHQMHYLYFEKGFLVGWTVLFEKDSEKRFSILVDSSYQRKGIGQKMIQALQADYTDFYGWVIDHDEDVKADGTPYLSPLKFYKKNGFLLLPSFRIDNDLLRAVKIHYPSLPT